MAHESIDYEDYTHPEKVYKDLVYAPDGKIPDEFKEQYYKKLLNGGNLVSRGLWTEELRYKELCVSCGWNVSNQIYSDYRSRIRIGYTRRNSGLWEVGSRWVIRDQPNDFSRGTDFVTQEFLRNQSPSVKIPLLKEMRLLSAPTDKVELVLMSRVPGKPLVAVWDFLTAEQKSKVVDQLSDAMRTWRQFTSPIAQNVDGSIAEDSIIGNCGKREAPTCKKMGRTTEEWFSNLEADIRFGLSRMYPTEDPADLEERFQELKRNFPKSELYVLTHGDLSMGNIIVDGDKVEAIIDWQNAAYLPWWAERWLFLTSSTDQADEVFDLIWAAKVDLDMDEDTFYADVMYRVSQVIKAWRSGSYDAIHPNQKSSWIRPGFCECQPYTGHIEWKSCGNQLEHHLNVDE